MPERPEPKIRPHPWAEFYREPMLRAMHAGDEEEARARPMRRSDAPGVCRYAELAVTSNYTFLTGASHPEELVEQAALLGYAAIAITDCNTVAGIVRAHVAAKESGVPLVVGCRVIVTINYPETCDIGAANHSLSLEGGGQGVGGALFPRRCTEQETTPHPPPNSLPQREGEWRARTGETPVPPSSVPPSSVLPNSVPPRSVPPLCLLIYPTDVASYGRLCRLLTLGKRRAPKGACHLTLHDLLEHSEGLLAIVMPPAQLDHVFLEVLAGLRRTFGDDRLSLAVSRLYGKDDQERCDQLVALSAHARVPLVAINDVHYHVPARRPLQDVLTCIRHGCTIEEAGLRLFPNGERYLKPPDEMARLFADIPGAIERTVQIAQRTAGASGGGFNLDQLRYQYPDEVCPPGLSPIEHLTNLSWEGAAQRYPNGVPADVRKRIEHELKLIDELDYAPYFLTVHDLVVYARSIGILCQGRGAAANSAVCYVLGVTAVDPDRIDLLFERFISKERNEPPDIDIDFEHERREEVIQYIYRKYGRERAALCAEVITYRGRSAVRDVGKAMGLSLDCVDRLAKDIDWWSDRGNQAKRLRALGLDPDEPTLRMVQQLTEEILGFPRHLSQHVGGFVITRGPLCEMVPIENAAMDDRTVIEWDKDDIDAMGMLKVDCLGLGMLTAIGWCFRLLQDGDKRAAGSFRRDPTAGRGARDGATSQQINKSTSQHSEGSDPLRGTRVAAQQWPPSCLTHIPPEEPCVYDAICHADTIGVFQIESRAQMSMLPRLRPRCFYDLVIEVAIVRPGPIQGDMVHPYLRRRNGEEPIVYPTEEVKRVLGKTLGVPLFQEQAMALAIVAAGFTPGEADQLRRAMAAWKRNGDKLLKFENRFIGGMLERGYERDFAERCFRQLRGFSEYGFPESHAASFALLVYVSAWFKVHHPAAFAAALINSQPMGFYAPAQIVRDAQQHGVEVRGVDVNCSEWNCTLEENAPCLAATRPQGGERVAAGQVNKSTNQQVNIRRDALPSADSGSRLNDHSPCLRLGLRLVRGLKQVDADAVVEAVRRSGPFASIAALHRAAGVRVSALRRLAAADAFQSMGLDRQSALWHVRAMRDEVLPMFADVDVAKEKSQPQLALPEVAMPRRVIQDYESVGLSLKAHPMSFLRESLTKRRVTRNIELTDEVKWPNNTPGRVAGLVLVRQRPATASGLIFMTIEDETGIANLIVRPKVYERCRRAAKHGVAIMASGMVERQGEVVHVIVKRIVSLDDEISDLLVRSRDFH